MEKSIDPVCGMSVDDEGSLKATYHGHHYHFCSEQCREEFQKSPERYAETAA
jgi:Cu+-exporting ATPase